MPFGYTFLDPVIVLSVCSLIVYYLSSKPIMVLGWLPAAVSLYFFIPFVTLITIGQLVAILLIVYFFVRTKRLIIQLRVRFLLAFFLLAIFTSFCYALIAGNDSPRVFIRAVFYVGIFAVFLFSYEMGQKDTAMTTLLKGLIILGVVLAIYGLYQVSAQLTGLPFRGIVRGTYGAQFATEFGIPRINSFASEPKRLGYVLFVCCLACFEWARLNPDKGRKYKFIGIGIFLTSLMTLSGSYFLSLIIFFFIYLFQGFRHNPLRAGSLGILLIALSVLLSSSQFGGALNAGFDRRMLEVEEGIDGQRVYRQEFFAQDFLLKNPEYIVLGVGLGQYYSALNTAYFPGVGKSESGRLIPMNSLVLEMLFDTNIFAVLLFFMGLLFLARRLKRRGELFLHYALILLMIQSATIQTLPMLAIFSGFSVGYLYRVNTFSNDAVVQVTST